MPSTLLQRTGRPPNSSSAPDREPGASARRPCPVFESVTLGGGTATAGHEPEGPGRGDQPVSRAACSPRITADHARRDSRSFTRPSAGDRPRTRSLSSGSSPHIPRVDSRSWPIPGGRRPSLRRRVSRRPRACLAVARSERRRVRSSLRRRSTRSGQSGVTAARNGSLRDIQPRAGRRSDAGSRDRSRLGQVSARGP